MGKRYYLGEAGVRKLRAIMNGRGESGAVRGSVPGLALEDDFAHPFTVQWAASAGDSGAWIIWLPSTDLLVVYGEPVDLTADLEPAGGDYPSGWYVIDDEILSAEDGGSLNLKVKESESEGARFEAEFVGDDDSGDEDEDALTIAVASCSVDSTSGGRSVRQYVSSELVIGGLKTEVAGDSEESEWLEVAGKKIVIQGYPGDGDGAAELDNCGLTFTTVSARVGENGEKIPAKIIVGVLEKDPEESWAARTMIVPLPGGGTKVVHFLGCDDVDLSETGGGGGGDDPEEVCERVVSLTGDAYQSAKLQGDVTVKGATGSGLEVKSTEAQNAQQGAKNKGGEMVVDLKGRADLENCGKNFAIHQIKFRDANGDIQIYHGLFCGDIDLTTTGKLIERTTVSPSATPGGQNVMKFYYTDGSSDTFSIANGMNGSPGSPGKPGEAPEIEVGQHDGHTYLFVDGELVATIPDGHTPEITADKVGKVTTIYADGRAIATINDGSDGEDDEDLEEVDMVTGVSFSISGGKLIAQVSKKKVKAKVVADLGSSNVDVADVKEVDVVTSESYSTSSHQFTNVRRRIKVLGDVAATGQTPFTATPLSSE